MAKILVSGGAGFIGSHVVEMFISHVYEVVVSDGTAKVGKTRHIDPIAAKANREPG
jgi:nucleoside-diphosphate-sugar epimerase